MFKMTIVKGNMFFGLGIVLRIDRQYDEYIFGLVICNLFIGFVSSIDLI